MKRILVLLLVVTGMVIGGNAQITVTKNDMPQPGDTLRVSMTNVVPVDYTQTAFDTAWDFSMLTPVTQRVESYVGMGSVPPEYWYVFIPTIVANLATPTNTNLQIPGFPVSDSYTFFNNTNTGFSDVGSAYKVAGLPLPMKYDVPDLNYPFPLSPGMTWNSASQSTVSMPSLAYLHVSRTRSSIADGWGSLVTPFGTFNTIRVKTLLIQDDSVHLDSLGVGIPLYRNITQYKWLANGEGIPVLQVNVELGMVSAVYRDIYRQGVYPFAADLGPDTAVLKYQSVTLSPVITNGVPPYRYIWSNFDTTPAVTLTIDTTIQVGVIVFDGLNNMAMDFITISVKYPPGIGENESGSLRIEPNPNSGDFSVMLPDRIREGTVLICDLAGRAVFSDDFNGATGKLNISVPGLKPGYYALTITNTKAKFTGTLVIR
jgi:hypothetical protein